MDFDIKDLEFSPAEVAELNGPFTPAHAMEGLKLGFLTAISEAGLLPSDVEDFLKRSAATGPVSSMTNLFGSAATGYKELAGIAAMGGALGGAYTGWARSRLDQILDGNDDPEVVGLKRRIKAYKSMNQDLKRTTGL